MVEREKGRLAGQDPALNAGTAAEIERLRDELAEAREQLAATSEVLAVIGRSASDLEGVLETVVESARKLCGADVGQVFLVDGDRYRFAYGSGMTPEYREFIANNPVVLDRGTLVGRVGLDRRATQITDVLADPDYGRPDAQRVAGYRTIMGVPMLLDGEVVGVLSVWRTQVDPFSDRAVEVLTTFAAQAALAVRTVDLVRALESRTDELGRKVNSARGPRRSGPSGELQPEPHRGAQHDHHASGATVRDRRRLYLRVRRGRQGVPRRDRLRHQPGSVRRSPARPDRT